MPPDFLPTHHRSLRLQNFTAFGDTTFEFVPGVNVLVGENGTGKTHVLKLLYAAIESRWSTNYSVISEEVFGGPHNSSVVRGDGPSSVMFDPTRFEVEQVVKDVARGAVFIPPTDMIGHTKGFLALDRQYRIDFDRTYGDLVSKLELQTTYDPQEFATSEMRAIQNRMGGTVEYDAADKRFYLATSQGRIAMPLVAEGIRKFATLHTVWKNGWLRPGTCLFWDEPEANLNPSLMDEAVAAILALARGGVQVFLATHSYVILKELEVQATKDDAVRFFALEKTDGGTVVHPADRYLDLKPNLIEDQYNSLFERTLEKRLREERERV